MNNQLKTSIDKILDEQADNLSAEICSKLNQSRQIALNHSLKTKFNPLLWIIPVAASVVLSVYIIKPLNSNIPLNTNIDGESVNNNYSLAEDMEVSEDLDFYLWLAQEESVNI